MLRILSHTSPVPAGYTVEPRELAARCSSINLTDGFVEGGELDIVSLGLNWWLSPVFEVNLNYRFTTLDKDGLSGDANGVMARVLLLLE